ncbi:uncharacterized protein LY89DRAFT_731831 [Mollisia scopiformis]|uniref:Uncharacterized protein n=1 Tax=Mollisia scopiformis TaxID=149040 RepID=A0A194XGZ0_MOLSC|nr:uncharacterized protein LY89DRAFT_731831 [Mollisia scopiformis]KUJ19433.1 hypothetical protein LY89DRAFT_731831 [Mollisia scopiformis]
MSGSMQPKIQFINLSSAATGKTKETTTAARRQARSHSARETHARARRLRAMNYQLQTAKQGVRESLVNDGDKSYTTTSVGRSAESDAKILSDPVSLLAPDRRDPFSSFVKPFTPIENFLLDYYVRIIIPETMENCIFFKGIENGFHSMMSDWLQLALTDIGFLSSIFLSACRHLCLYQDQEQKYRLLAIQYKLVSLHKLGEAVLRGPSSVNSSTIANALALALEEAVLGNIITFRNHVLGATKMVELNDGAKTFGLSSFLRSLVQSFIANKEFLGTAPGPDEIPTGTLEHHDQGNSVGRPRSCGGLAERQLEG